MSSLPQYTLQSLDVVDPSTITTPLEEQLWYIRTSATPIGLWAGQGGKIAIRVGAGWTFSNPDSSFQYTVVDRSNRLHAYSEGLDDIIPLGIDGTFQRTVFVSQTTSIIPDSGTYTGNPFREDDPCTTIAQAVAAVGALGNALQPSVIRIIGGGAYTEEVILPDFCLLYAPDAQINGRLSLGNFSEAFVYRILSIDPSKNVVEQRAGTGSGSVDAGTIVFNGAGGGILNLGGGIFNVRATAITVNGGFPAIGSTTDGGGTYNLHIETLNVNGVGATGLIGRGNRMRGRVANILTTRQGEPTITAIQTELGSNHSLFVGTSQPLIASNCIGGTLSITGRSALGGHLQSVDGTTQPEVRYDSLDGNCSGVAKPILYRSGEWPNLPAEGLICVRTDYGSEMFTYHASKNVWVGQSAYEISAARAANVASPGYLFAWGDTTIFRFAANVGWPHAFPTVCVMLSTMTLITGTYTLQVVGSGLDITDASMSITAGGSASLEVLSDVIPTNALIALRVSGGTLPAHFARAVFRRAETHVNP